MQKRNTDFPGGLKSPLGLKKGPAKKGLLDSDSDDEGSLFNKDMKKKKAKKTEEV